MNHITVCIPTIPPRAQLLLRAVSSVQAQELPAAGIIIATDTERAGAAATRDRALQAVRTPWVSFLDDDDEFYSAHLRRLLEHAEDTGADYVFSWYDVLGGGTDPRPEEFGMPWDPEHPRQTTITTLVRTELAQQVGFVNPDDTPLNSPDRLYAGEDYYFTSELNRLGAKISHLPERTWAWYHHSSNTSGLPTRW